MESPVWIAGGEKRFATFLGSLNDADVIALISHKADLDGIISAKVISQAIEPDLVRLVDYAELNAALIEELHRNKVTKIIISDLNFKRREDIFKLESFASLLIIDHHQFTEDFNSEKTVFMNAQGMCAAYLSYYLFSKEQDLKSLEWAVACASLSDWCWKANQRFLFSVFVQYGEKFVAGDEEVKQGKFWEFQYQLYLALIYDKDRIINFYEVFPTKFGELGSLAKNTREVQEEVDRALIAFDRDKKLIDNRYVWEFSGKFGVRELIINIRSHEHPTATFIIYILSKDFIKCSFRRQDRGEDVSILARELVKGFEESDGGGHKAAAGCLFPVCYLPEFLERLEKF